jgi:serine/threonine-protein kinase RsbW
MSGRTAIKPLAVETVPRSLRLELTDAPDPATAAPCVDWLEETVVRVARAGGVVAEEADFLGVAVREAVLNALRHGRGPDGRCHIVVRLRNAFDRLLLVTIQDRGPGFDLAGVADPCLPENMAKGSGRGIFYMRRFADRVSFGFPRSGGVLVRIGKRLPGSP